MARMKEEKLSTHLKRERYMSFMGLERLVHHCTTQQQICCPETKWEASHSSLFSAYQENFNRKRVTSRLLKKKSMGCECYNRKEWFLLSIILQ